MSVVEVLTVVRVKASSNVEWQKWGQRDLLFAVASWKGREKDGVDPWTVADFYALGASDWDDFAPHWRQYGWDTDSCLEIGCGTGRITLPLAQQFRRTYALDVSREMVEYAKAHIEDPSIEFLVSDGVKIPLSDGSVSAVFSTHVFQHFDTTDHASAYFQEIARVLKLHGTMMIHLPIYRWPAMHGLFERIYKLRRAAGQWRAAVNRFLISQNVGKPTMRGTIYPVDYFYRVLPALGFEDIEIRIFPTKSNGGLHPFVFARKRDGSKEKCDI
jgi:ubiquinone/menaquinone biosynthesis C-methylase UbiE